MGGMAALVMTSSSTKGRRGLLRQVLQYEGADSGLLRSGVYLQIYTPQIIYF